MAKAKVIKKRKAAGKSRAKAVAGKDSPPRGQRQVNLLVGLSTQMKLFIDKSVDPAELQLWLREGWGQLEWKRNTVTGPEGNQIGTFEIVRSTVREISADM